MDNITETSWMTFMLSYCFHPKYGFLLPPDYQIKYFNFRDLEPSLVDIDKKTLTLPDVEEFINRFPQIKMRAPTNLDPRSQMEYYMEMLTLHDILAHIVQTHWRRYRQKKEELKKKGVELATLRIKSKISIPLMASIQVLQTKLGMNSAVTFLWESLPGKQLTEPENFSFNNFKLRRYFTSSPQDQEMEKLFFGGSIIASYFLMMINQEIFNINRIIERKEPDAQIKRRFRRIIQLWEKITEQNRFIQDKSRFTADFFYDVLRPFLYGYKDVEFQMEEKEIKLISSRGGSAGQDPSFQIFEKGIGLQFEGFYKQLQNDLKKGMCRQHIQLIEKIGQTSKVREHCSKVPELTQEYNNVLNKYLQFLTMHSRFIEVNILQKLIKKQGAEGTGGTAIKMLIEREAIIAKQLLATLKE